jgi:Tol biopolymer transport system component
VFGNDIFVRNLETGTTALVSVNRFGTSSANGDSRLGALSGDGRFVVFASNAKDLVDAYTNFADLYVRDLQTEITTLLSVDRIENRGGNSASIWISVISTDNRFVAFDSYAQNLVTTPMTGSLIHNVFVRPLP